MRIRSGVVPTPIVGVSQVKMPEPVLAPAVTAPKPEADPMVIAMGTATQIELQKGELARVVEKMNETARIFNHALRFQVAESNRVIIHVIDTVSGEVVREIPPEKLMDAFNRLEDAVGLLLDWKV